MSLPEITQHLRGRRLPTVAVATCAIALVAWVALVEGLVPMPGSGTAMADAGPVAVDSGTVVRDGMTMDDRTAMDGTATGDGTVVGPMAPSVVEAMGTSNGVAGVLGYLLMWGVMMVAMMYPPSVGLFQWYADWDARRHRSGVSAGASDGIGADVVGFVGGYTLVWVLVGLVPLAVNLAVPLASLATTWDGLYYGVGFLGVAAFQLSPLKRRYLGHCRRPSGWLDEESGSGSETRLASGTGTRSRLRSGTVSGWHFGWEDVGSCGVLMGLMVLVGSMNVAWIAAITVVLLLERVTAHGQFWATAVGVLAGVGGVVLVGTWLL